MMASRYDVIVIGGGHNGLTAAAFMAKAGARVIVFEGRQVLGGAAATEELFPGYRFNTGAADSSLFRAAIVSELELENQGLRFIEPDVVCFAPNTDGPPLTLWRDPERTASSLSFHSASDAANLAPFLKYLDRQTTVLRDLMLLTPPDPGRRMQAEELGGWLRTGLKVRLQGRRAMMEFVRTLPLTAAALLDDWFETVLLKGTLGTLGVRGAMQGPLASGTALLMLYHMQDLETDRMPGIRFVRGGLGQLAVALAQAARGRGAVIRCGESVGQILVEDYRAIGVRLSSGEEVLATAIASSADPRQTLLELVGPQNLPVRVLRRTRNIRFRGSTAQVHLALSGLPHFAGQESVAELNGRITISPSLEYIERAYDDSKYGGFSRRPILEAVIPTLGDPGLAPPGRHIMSIRMQYAPYHLADADWDDAREPLGDLVIDTMAEYAPTLKGLVLDRRVITPLDWERDYGLPEGSIYHGQMALDQLLFMRPIAGFGRYKTPIDGLYFCGAGAHPGGGVTGLPGYNAAQVILSNLG